MTNQKYDENGVLIEEKAPKKIVSNNKENISTPVGSVVLPKHKDKNGDEVDVINICFTKEKGQRQILPVYRILVDIPGIRMVNYRVNLDDSEIALLNYYNNDMLSNMSNNSKSKILKCACKFMKWTMNVSDIKTGETRLVNRYGAQLLLCNEEMRKMIFIEKNFYKILVSEMEKGNIGYTFHLTSAEVAKQLGYEEHSEIDI